MNLLSEQLLIYSLTILICGLVVYFYLLQIKKKSKKTQDKLDQAKVEGRFVPISLHPHIDLNTCIGSGACISACPEKDILGIVSSQATVINATSCIGHGACFHACPVEAISLRIGTETRGVELPHVNENYETNIKGIFIAGELGGMGLIKNSMEQGKQAVYHINKSNKTKRDNVFDLLIIGAGPAGISASLAARDSGLNFLTVDQDSLGGTVFSFPRSKVIMTNPVDVPLIGKIKLFNTSKQELLEIWEKALSENDIAIKEHTKVDRIVPVGDELFKVVSTTGEQFMCLHVLLAIGRRGSPRKLGVQGEGLPKVAYRLLDAEQIEDRDILVVGGGDSAVESAMLLMDKNRVILSYRKDQFARIKAKNQENINQVFTSGSMRIIFNSNLKAIKEKEVVISVEGEEDDQIIPNDLVYIFAGGELPTKFLQNAGVEITKRFAYIIKKH